MTRTRLPIDPALKRFLEERAAQEAANAGPPPHSDLERALATRAGTAAALALRGEIAGVPRDLDVRDVTLGPSLAGRLYVPRTPPRALLVHLHGGAWVTGSLASHDPFCRLLCAAAEVAVLAVDYRLAPEHPYPAALDDAATALAWAQREASTLGGRIVLSGDSAGANLAAVLASRLAHAGPTDLAALVLLFPVTDHPANEAHPSYSEPPFGFGPDLMNWAWRVYAGHVSPAEPAISPLRWHPMPALPPTFVGTAEYDILRDEGIAYAEKLRAAGIEVTHHHTPDMHHNFWVSAATVARFPRCGEALAALAGWLRARTERHDDVV